MASSYYKPCKELEICEELIKKYYDTKQYDRCFEGHLVLADNEYPLAECQIGYFYYDGLGVEKNLDKAFYWTERAAVHGDRDGQNNLAWFYEDGIGVAKDIDKAKYWYKKAALQDHDMAIDKCHELNVDINDGTIVGNKVILRETKKEDAKFFAYWYNKPDVMFKCGFTEETNEEEEIKAIERHAISEDGDWYTITDLDGNIIGETGLLRMWPIWHCTDLSIIIPNPECQGKGYGTEAISLMFDLAFNKYDMNRISIGVVAKNTYALDFYKKVGFKQEGIQEQGYYYDGEYSDFIMMRILREEWMNCK